MNLYDTFILSAVEALTEFLPVSSTGHMIVVSDFLNLDQTEFLKSFEIIIQLGAILAIVFLYRQKIKIKEISLWLKVLLSFLPVGVVGFIFKDQIKELFSTKIVAIMFILGGLFIFIFEYFYQKKKKENQKNIEKITYKQAFFVGLFQTLSFIPGTSRSLTTIFGTMFFNFSRTAATEFSFLMALPVMFAVSFYELFSSYKNILNSDYKLLAIGFLLSFLFTFFVVKIFLKFTEKFSFNIFGSYRILFGVLLLVFFV